MPGSEVETQALLDDYLDGQKARGGGTLYTIPCSDEDSCRVAPRQDTIRH
jgi:hypothetical protein